MPTLRCKKLMLAVASVIAADVAIAQTDEKSYSSIPGLEEVFVTARKRSESIQDIPVSIDVISGDSIARMNMATTKQLADQAPNIVMVQGNFGLAAPIISIRGVTNSNFTASSNSPVSFYADDVVINNIQPQGFALFDIDRVEMLRGPQGTLFGRNSTSGAISVHSAKPTEELTGYARGSIGNFGAQRYEAALSGTVVSDALLGRIAVTSNRRDGTVDNTALNRKEAP